jgi:hypothetical protein
MEKAFTLAGIVIFYILLPACYLYLVWAWVRWARLTARFPPPRWRSLLAFIAFLLSSGSALWSIVLIVHARITGGFPFYHPVLLASIRFGLLASLASMVLGALGKGIVRVPAILGAAVMLLVWLGEAAAQ